jgi:ComF family protein
MIGGPSDMSYTYAMALAEQSTARSIAQVRRMAVRALDLLFPPLCVGCRASVETSHALCPTCWSNISFLDGACCTGCGLPFPADPGGETLCGACHASPRAFERTRALMRYDDASKPLILKFKNADRLDYAPAFAQWLERAGKPPLKDADLIVPVPLHRWRLWRRRYNQSALLAAHLARLTGKDWDARALIRSRLSPSQGAMPSAKARRRNVLGAFRVTDPARVKGKRILVVDDVFTTGATLEACARALKRAGASGVDVLALARVVREGGSII